jgi:hypothetical protein
VQEFRFGCHVSPRAVNAIGEICPKFPERPRGRKRYLLDKKTAFPVRKVGDTKALGAQTDKTRCANTAAARSPGTALKSFIWVGHGIFRFDGGAVLDRDLARQQKQF